MYDQTVLIVEDDQEDATQLGEYIREDYLPVKVGRLDEALDRCRDFFFDAIILDLTLPNSQGMEITEKVRQAAPDSGLVIVTGLTRSEVEELSIMAGADEFIRKGVDCTAETVLKMLRRSMARVKAARLFRPLQEKVAAAVIARQNLDRFWSK